MNTYRLRAEAPADIGRMLEHIDVQSMQYNWIGIGHVEITFTSPRPIGEIWIALKKVPDSHVMRRTFSYIEDYTGE